MMLVRMALRSSPRAFIICIVASLSYAIASLLLIASISGYIARIHALRLPAWAFLSLAFAAAAAHTAVRLGTNYTLLRIASDLRLSLTEEIAATPLRALEAAGSARIFTMLQEDTARVSSALPALVTSIKDGLFLGVCLGYLAWLSPAMALVTLTVIAAGFAIYYPLHRRGTIYQRQMAECSETSVALFRNFVDGIKQLKLSAQQRDNVVGAISQVQHEMRRIGQRVSFCFGLSTGSSTLTLFLLLFLLAYCGANDLVGSPAATFAVLMVLMVGPIVAIATAFEPISQSHVALDRIQAFRSTLRTDSPLVAQSTSEVVQGPRDSRSAVPLLEVRNLTHVYRDRERDEFCLGPLDLALHSGHVLFIVGGNGSGKTTLGKLLTGLYVPQTGEIRCEGKLVTDSERSWHRAHFSAVFADFCLFESLAAAGHDHLVAGAEHLVRWLRLNHIIDGSRGVLRQARSFSSGERRRVALLLSLLEDRPAYVFDEFAADQDPDCKDLFYREVLSHLKARNKLVIVITHDTRYFRYADFVLTLERGRSPVMSPSPAVSTSNSRSPLELS